jgi:hypothetical protein
MIVRSASKAPKASSMSGCPHPTKPVRPASLMVRCILAATATLPAIFNAKARTWWPFGASDGERE